MILNTRILLFLLAWVLGRFVVPANWEKAGTLSWFTLSVFTVFLELA